MPEFKIIAIISDPKELIINTTVYLFNKEKCVLVPIKMTSDAAENLILAKSKHFEPRPHIHNTTTRLVCALGGEIKRVIINKYHKEVFYSYIRVEGGNKTCDIDARPSDSMAIALRQNVPIFIEKCVYKEVGIVVTKELLDESASV